MAFGVKAATVPLVLFPQSTHVDRATALAHEGEVALDLPDGLLALLFHSEPAAGVGAQREREQIDTELLLVEPALVEGCARSRP